MFKRSLNIYLSLAVMGKCLRMGLFPLLMFYASHVNSKFCQKFWQNLLLLEISLFSSSLVLSQSQWFTDIALSSFYSFLVCLPKKESTSTAGTAFPSAVSCLAVLQPGPERQLHCSRCFFPVLLLSSGSLHPPSLPQPFRPSPPWCAFNRCIPPCVFLLSL